MGVLDAHTPKNEVQPLPATITNVNSKWIKDLYVKTKIIKVLEGILGIHLHALY